MLNLDGVKIDQPRWGQHGCGVQTWGVIGAFSRGGREDEMFSTIRNAQHFVVRAMFGWFLSSHGALS